MCNIVYDNVTKYGKDKCKCSAIVSYIISEDV